MTTEAAASFARLHDGLRPVSRPVEVSLVGDYLLVDAERFAVSEVRASPRAGSANRFISLPNGAELQVPEAPWIDQLPVPEQGALWLAWLEARAWVAASSLLGILGFAVWFWFAGLPLLTAFGAKHVPFSLEQRLGLQVLTNLDTTGYFAPSELEQENQAELRQRFATLVTALPHSEHGYQLVLRRAELGPNAIALPGNVIVLTDALVELCTGDEVSAVLAHELAHAHERHVMRSYLASVGLSALTTALWGGQDTTGVAIDTRSLQLLELGYSRELEQAADDGAFAILRRAHLRPALLADALERIAHPDADGETDEGEDEDEDEDEDATPTGGAWNESENEGGGENEGESEDDDEGGSEDDDGQSSGPEEPQPAPPSNWVELGQAEGLADSDSAPEAAELPVATSVSKTSDEDREASEIDELRNDWLGAESWSFLSTHPVAAERIAHARAQK